MRHLLHLLPFLAFGSLLSDVAGFLTSPFRSAAELAVHVWHAIRSLFLKLRDVFGHVWDAMQGFYTGIVAFGRAAVHFAQNVVGALGWLVETAVPAVGRWAWRKAYTFAKTAVHDLRTWAVAAITWLRRHAERLVAIVSRFARWAWRRLESAVAALSRWTHGIVKRLWDLVMHPARLVAWILPHLVTPLLRFIIDNARPVVALLFRFALKESVRAATVVEDELAKLL